ncbi:hypothetical protein E2C01_069313 [Portunus trituberculatus]|uniref:Uncharacterized protein n=1 Tax=Portunus trituberculatus TaxID=210409 RepID=A0A5B7HU75_PORTR|nr:hypothetical protein [Portunus trituberculatus]
MRQLDSRSRYFVFSTDTDALCEHKSADTDVSVAFPGGHLASSEQQGITCSITTTATRATNHCDIFLVVLEVLARRGNSTMNSRSPPHSNTENAHHFSFRQQAQGLRAVPHSGFCPSQRVFANTSNDKMLVLMGADKKT